MPMNVLVAGAGYTGRRLASVLPAEHTFVTRRRCPPEAGKHCIALDLDADSVDLALPPAPWACLYSVPPPEDADGDRDRDLDPRLAGFLNAIKASVPERLVYLSTSGVYGDRQGALTDETVPVSPLTARARRRVAAEQMLERFCRANGTALAVLRVPGIYGPGRLGLDRLRAGATVLDDADAPPGNRIHVDDLVAACRAALLPSAPPGIYNVGDGDHRTSSAFTQAIARLAGLPAPQSISRTEAETQWSSRRLSFFNESRRLDTQKMRTELGVTPRYQDPETGIRACLEADRHEIELD